MADNRDFTIRPASVKDLKALTSFFKIAYGEKTVFQDPGFLKYYFKSFEDKNDPLGANLIAINFEGEIISHYGGLHYVLILADELVSGCWGVNAFTLPEWRGRGINSKIVKSLAEKNDFNAVIGMPFEAPFFYKKYGYNIFDKKTLSRFLLVLNQNTFEIIEYLGQDLEKARQILDVTIPGYQNKNTDRIFPLTKNNFPGFGLEMELDVLATTFRSRSFLNWRIFNNPYIDYTVTGYVVENKILAYVVIREELLKPQDYRVARIIDLYGKSEYVEELLDHQVGLALKRNCIYIDFSLFGNIYDDTLKRAGFVKLDDNDCCLVPQVTAPVENRPNHEFIVIQSQKRQDKIERLSPESVYFTRIDGDRDRIAQISQLKG